MAKVEELSARLETVISELQSIQSEYAPKVVSEGETPSIERASNQNQKQINARE